MIRIHDVLWVHGSNNVSLLCFMITQLEIQEAGKFGIIRGNAVAWASMISWRKDSLLNFVSKSLINSTQPTRWFTTICCRSNVFLWFLQLRGIPNRTSSIYFLPLCLLISWTLSEPIKKENVDAFPDTVYLLYLVYHIFHLSFWETRTCRTKFTHSTSSLLFGLYLFSNSVKIWK